MLYAQPVALGLIATALAASGCGDSSTTASTTTATAPAAATTAAIKTTTVKLATGSPLTRTTLIAKGDAICARTNAKLAAMSVGSEAAFQRVLPQLAVYDSAEANELGKLVPPASLAGDWSRIITAAHLYSEYVKRIASHSQEKSLASAKSLIITAEGLRRQMATIARQDGFRHCAKVG